MTWAKEREVDRTQPWEIPVRNNRSKKGHSIRDRKSVSTPFRNFN